MKKIINSICVILGFLALFLGMIGIVLPILPTTPFLLLAALLFAKGSEKFHRWFVGTTLYRKYIENTIHKKEMTKKAKVSTLTVISALLLIGFVFSPVWYAKLIIAFIAVGHYYYFLFRIKTVAEPNEESTQDSASPGKDVFNECD